MRIALDAMGGDNAPAEIVAGAIEALDLLDPDDKIILAGPHAVVEEQIPRSLRLTSKLQIIDAPEVIAMDEPPVESLRQKIKSSINVIAKLAKRGEAEAVISAGNTGACVAAFQMRMRNIEGVNRPGIAVVFPTLGGPVTVCDVGANIACKPINLYQYAVMAQIYSQNIYGVGKPRVGILSIGSEDAKGNEVVKKAREFIKADPSINFVGNVEGRDVFKGVCDVVVCDGFVGNVMLKLAEGLVDGLFKAIKNELMQEKMMLALKFKPVMMRIYQKYDYHEYGGALLLGINGTAVICHGSSKARTIKNAIIAAKKFHTAGITTKIAEYLSKSSIEDTNEQDQPS